MNVLLDTNVVSELMRPNTNPAVRAWVDAIPLQNVHVSAITLAELLRGIEQLAVGRRKRELVVALDRLFANLEERVLPVDRTVAEHWAAMNAAADRAGRPLPSMDSLIAATARAHGLLVATRNTADMGRCGVQVFNPWHA